MISCDQYDTPLVRDGYMWQNDSDTDKCNICKIKIQRALFKTNKHHCRYCGKIVCVACSTHKHNENRICDICVVKKEKLEKSAIKLAPTPDAFSSSVSDAIMINNNTFMFISCDISKYGIYHYNVSIDQWKQSDVQHHNIRHDNVAYNSHTNMLYSVINKALIRYNMKKNSFETLDVLSFDQIGEHWKCIFINNEFHVIGSGLCFGQHYIYNEQTEQLLDQKAQPFLYLREHELIYLEKKRTLFLFGGKKGRNPKSSESSNSIYKCNYFASENRWKCKELSIKMPFRLYAFGIVSCQNDRYILFFGGKEAKLHWNFKTTDIISIHPEYCSNIWESTHSNIYIFDVEKYEFIMSNVKCPIGGSCKAFITNNNMDVMDVLLSGYIREIDEVNYLPQDIHGLICEYAVTETEWVHVISHNQYFRTHWKIDLKYIFKHSDKFCF